jgi:hypothetical protein
MVAAHPINRTGMRETGQGAREGDLLDPTVQPQATGSATTAATVSGPRRWNSASNSVTSRSENSASVSSSRL